MPQRQQNAAAAAARVPDSTRVYAVGDIHGRADLLAEMHQAIRDDRATGAPAERQVLVYLGDYIDRGPQSFEVVDMLINEPLEGFEIVHLKGNHEDFLIRFVADSSLGTAWMINGGSATLVSYKVDIVDLLLGERGLKKAYRRIRQTIPRAHLDFYHRLKLHHAEGGYLFVHAGLRPGVALDDQVETDLLWIRHEFLDCGDPFGHVVVHGHTIEPEPDIHPNRIGIDTGAYASGRLTCLVLEGETSRFLQT